jgi:hypothetical protein
MATRQRLANRRGSETFDVESQGLKFTATVSRWDGGGIAEVFLQNHKAGSAAGIMASDAAIAASLAMQYGCPPEVLGRALSRDSRGNASGPLGCAIDEILHGKR